MQAPFWIDTIFWPEMKNPKSLSHLQIDWDVRDSVQICPQNVSAATLTSSDSEVEHLEQVGSLSGNKKDLGEEVNIQGNLEQQTVSIQVNKDIWSSRQ